MAKRKTTSKCLRCGSVFHPVYQSSGKYCSLKCSVRYGRANHNWKGGELGYSAAHSWLRTYHTKDKKICDFCGGTKHLEFALKKGRKYTRNISDYHILCIKCHKKYDVHEPWNKGMRPSPKKCEKCGNDFIPPKKRQRFCSNKCSAQWLALKEPVLP